MSTINSTTVNTDNVVSGTDVVIDATGSGSGGSTIFKSEGVETGRIDPDGVFTTEASLAEITAKGDKALTSKEYVDDEITSATVLPTASHVSVYQSAAQSISSGSAQIVQFNTESYDTNTEWDTTNYRFSPASTGYFTVNCNVALVSTNAFGTSDYFKISIYYDASPVLSSIFYPDHYNTSNNVEPLATISSVISIASTSYIDIRVEQVSGVSINTTNSNIYTFLTIDSIR